MSGEGIGINRQELILESLIIFLLFVFLLMGTWKVGQRHWRWLTFVGIILPYRFSHWIKAITPSVLLEKSFYKGENGEEIPMQIYHPPKSGKQPAFIIYPGASPAGEEHEALNLIAEGMAKVGMRVFIPRLPEMKDVLLGENTVEQIKNCYQQLSQREDVETSRIAVAGMSFSGSLVIKAFTEYKNSKKPACISSYGSYFDLIQTLRFALTGDFTDGENRYHLEPNKWGRVVFFHNYLDLLEDRVDIKLMRPYFLKIVKNDEKGAEEIFQQMSEKDKDFIRNINEGKRKILLNLAKTIFSTLEPENRKLSPKYFIEKIQFPLFLMHGAHDDMIPYTETVMFGRALQESGKHVETFISYLYAHSEVNQSQPGFQMMLNEIWQMGKFLNKIFNRLYQD